jgi:uncharacterized protein
MRRRRVALLDVNLLVALFDPDHIHHELAHDWFSDNRAEGWATCPVTENGLVRVLTNPRYDSPVSTAMAVVERLKKFRRSGHHEFWFDGVSLTDESLFKPASARGHRQITDVYLLGSHAGTADDWRPWTGRFRRRVSSAPRAIRSRSSRTSTMTMRRSAPTLLRRGDAPDTAAPDGADSAAACRSCPRRGGRSRQSRRSACTASRCVCRR